MADGKWYIGQSSDIESRTRDHLQSLRASRHHNIHFQRAFKKYSEGMFEMRVLEAVEEAMLDARERAWIIHYQSNDAARGYNFESGGHFGKHISASTKRKLSRLNVGKVIPEQVRAKISKTLTGKTVSELTRARLVEAHRRRSAAVRRRVSERSSEVHKGKILSAETKRKLSEANLGKRATPETRAKISAALKAAYKANPRTYKPVSLEARRKMSVAMKGRRFSKLHRARLKEAWRRQPEAYKQAHAERASQIHKGKTIPPEMRQRLSELNKGKIMPVAVRKKIGAAVAAYHARLSAEAMN